MMQPQMGASDAEGAEHLHFVEEYVEAAATLLCVAVPAEFRASIERSFSALWERHLIVEEELRRCAS